MRSPVVHPFRWPLSIDSVWLFMPIFVVCVRALLQPIPMEDYWWHLVMGRHIDVTGQVPQANLFLYTMPANAPFYDQPWLAQWLMYRCVTWFDHRGIVVLHTLLLVAGWVGAIGAGFRRGGTPVVVGVSAALAYFVSASTLMPRTQMFAYPLFVGVVLILLRIAAAPRIEAPALVGLTVLTALWANVHGSFVLAPALAGVVAVGWAARMWNVGDLQPRDWAKRWIPVGVLALVATTASPGGLTNLMYPFSILGATKGEGPMVLEWAPVDLTSLPGLLFGIWLLLTAIAMWRDRDEVTAESVLLLAAVAVLALTSVRAILWAALVLVIVGAPHVSRLRPVATRERPTGAEPFINLGLLGALALCAVLTLPGGPVFDAIDPEAMYADARLRPEGPESVLSARNPDELLPALRALPPNARIFHHQALGGYLEWHLSVPGKPAQVAFIDQRLEIVGALWGDYFTVSRTHPGWEAVVQRHGIDTFLIEPDEQALLVEHLDRSSTIEVVGSAGSWRLYRSRGPMPQ